MRASTAAKAMQLYDESIRAGCTAEMCHPLAVRLLQPGTEFRAAVETVAAGGVMSAGLATEAARLKFIPLAERTIEQPHALVNLRVGKKTVVGPYVSLAARMPFLSARLQEPENMALFIQKYSETES
eukprot:4268074-Lingulodinium_polyedra.AAC.1